LVRLPGPGPGPEPPPPTILPAAGTVLSATRALMAAGAKCVTLAVTHGMFSGRALDLINDEPAIVRVITCDRDPPYSAHGPHRRWPSGHPRIPRPSRRP